MYNRLVEGKVVFKKEKLLQHLHPEIGYDYIILGAYHINFG